MRIRVSICTTLLFALAAPLLLHAQFQQPTKQELEMTSDPQAPGAAAVILYREERTDDNLHYHGIYERIKVLTEKGKEAATIRIPYEHGVFEVTDIQGRTIHADGTVVPLTSKPSDLVNVKSKDYQVNTMVFTLPSVEVGSILEYRLQIRYDDKWISSPEWDIQRRYFAHKEHYFFQPYRDAEGLMYAFRSKPDTKVIPDTVGRYTYDVTDVPAIPSEDWMPPLNSVAWRIQFYYTDYMSGGDFWKGAGKNWWRRTEHFANVNNTLREAAAKIVAPTDSEQQKAEKIYAAVQGLENTSFTREKSQAERKAEKLKETKDASIAWVQKSGSANELALLYVALANAAGLKAYPMQVVNRDSAIFDVNYLNTDQLDDYIAIVELNGKELYLDPGQKMCPFGLLHWKHTLAGGMRGSEKGPGYGNTPANMYTQNTTERLASITLNQDGTISGNVRFVFNGQEAMHWRQRAILNDADEVKKEFNEWMRSIVPDGVVPELDHFLALDQFDVNLMAIVKVSGSMGTATGKHVFEPGVFFESRAKHPFAAQTERAVPVDVHYAKRLIDESTYFLPAGFSVESAPATTDIPWAGSAVLKIQSNTTGNAVTVTRSFVYSFTVLGAKEYGTLHDYYQKIASADQQPLVLTRVAQVAASK